MILWTAGHNMPGYLPESEPVAFETRLDARTYMSDELGRAAERAAEIGDDLYAQEYDAAALSLGEHDADVDGDWYDTFEDGRIAYWFQAVDVTKEEAREMLEGE